ncbi:hypothetical protein B0T14DRAFT_522216 [Immersiella caudata]|uniref:Uncharacterized protein n=1 Tax=Immersiella caudata TaxID=314043 RepID=A0AA40C130_9PEZI|nr:hypothetical protein B0T14DRAFT_522216 [Immersiella caudata]
MPQTSSYPLLLSTRPRCSNFRYIAIIRGLQPQLKIQMSLPLADHALVNFPFPGKVSSKYYTLLCPYWFGPQFTSLKRLKDEADGFPTLQNQIDRWGSVRVLTIFHENHSLGRHFVADVWQQADEIGPDLGS